MYVGVDIGGTKTLVASLDDHGIIRQSIKFPTPKSYDDFIPLLSKTVDQLNISDFRAGGVAVPGRIDRENGIAMDCGNLPWHDIPIQSDAEKILKCPIVIENDANLGGLSESMLLPKETRLLYITISTGIGTGFIINQEIDRDLADSEGGLMLFEYHGKREIWENFASGRAIVERFGKRASEITDEKTLRRIAHDLSLGFFELITVLQPTIIAVGGSVGVYLDRFKPYLLEELNMYKNPLSPIPKIQQAKRPEQAVIYGCFDLARMRYGTNN